MGGNVGVSAQYKCLQSLDYALRFKNSLLQILAIKNPLDRKYEANFDTLFEIDIRTLSKKTQQIALKLPYAPQP